MASPVMKANDVKIMAYESMPSWLRQKRQVEILDSWFRGEQADSVYRPKTATDEYDNLKVKSPTPWLNLVVTAVTQTAFLEGVRRGASNDNMDAWSAWQENGWDARQAALYRATCAHGLAFATALPGVSPLTGDKTAIMRPVSARRMAAFYEDDSDEWPYMAMDCQPYLNEMGTQAGWTVKLYDEVAIHYLSCKGDGESLTDWTYISYEIHGQKVPPVVRYANLLDADGRATSEIGPLIPLASRIDQDTFDRLIVQRFGAWKVRYIAGLAKPENQSDAEAQKMRLRVEDLLIAGDPDTKFGTLDATDLAGFIAARDSDLRDLSAVSQTPPHHMLGLSSNLQAESLAAAEAGLQRKSMERRTSWGESHEQLFRLAASIRGNAAEARAFDMEVRWRDMESRSLEQAAMALGMLATNLKVPVELLWSKIPGFTDYDVERAKSLVESGSIDELIAQMTATPPPAAQDPAAPADAAA